MHAMRLLWWLSDRSLISLLKKNLWPISLSLELEYQRFFRLYVGQELRISAARGGGRCGAWPGVRFRKQSKQQQTREANSICRGRACTCTSPPVSVLFFERNAHMHDELTMLHMAAGCSALPRIIRWRPTCTRRSRIARSRTKDVLQGEDAS